MVLVGEEAWLPTSLPQGMAAQVADNAVTQVRAAAIAGLESVLIFAQGETVTGECLVVSDHINLTGSNPLVGPNVDAWGVRFPDMTEPYPWRTRLAPLSEAGVVADILAEPSKESLVAAEALGAEAVTSGLAAAVIAANHCSLRVGAVLIPARVDGRAVVERALVLMAG
jgi:purine-nucleoside phosphorylase